MRRVRRATAPPQGDGDGAWVHRSRPLCGRGPLLGQILQIVACFLHGFACFSGVGGLPSPPLWPFALLGLMLLICACCLHGFACFSLVGGSPSPPLWSLALLGLILLIFDCFLHGFACFSWLGWLAFALYVLVWPWWG